MSGGGIPGSGIDRAVSSGLNGGVRPSVPPVQNAQYMSQSPGSDRSRRPIEALPPLVAATPLVAEGDEFVHPMRTLTEDVAHSEAVWTSETARSVESVFDRLAPNWDEQFPSESQRLAPLIDALERGGVITFGAVADVGAGTAVSSAYLASRFEVSVGLDLSFEMLRRGPTDVARVQADAGRLPLGDDSLDAVVLMNAFLFPHEVDRVLRHDGVIIWVSSLGAATPIYLRDDELIDVLPGEWRGVRSATGLSTWTVLRRV